MRRNNLKVGKRLIISEKSDTGKAEQMQAKENKNQRTKGTITMGSSESQNHIMESEKGMI